MSTDWFRNTNWNEEIERDFDNKLLRAKKKDQYLRIQASTLARTHPDVALKLLDRYFQLNDNFDRAQANVDRANAFETLGRKMDAISAYEAALAHEQKFPNVLTQAYLKLPYLIATAKIHEKYGYALEILKKHKKRLTWPIEHFQWHAAYALIAAEQGEPAIAKTEADFALEVSAYRNSGFRYHPTLGLVTEEHNNTIEQLKSLPRQ